MDSVTITCGDERIVMYIHITDGFGEPQFGDGDFGGQSVDEALDTD